MGRLQLHAPPALGWSDFGRIRPAGGGGAVSSLERRQQARAGSILPAKSAARLLLLSLRCGIFSAAEWWGRAGAAVLLGALVQWGI